MEYFILSTTYFGLYIGHHQVSIKLIKRLYNLYGVLWGGTRSRFRIVGSMKIRTWDGVTNIRCSLVVEHLGAP